MQVMVDADVLSEDCVQSKPEMLPAFPYLEMAKILRGATGEFSNFYNLSARLIIFNTLMPPIITTHTSKFRSFLFDTF